MILYPAMDLMGGRAVRLVKGDFDRSTGYGDDPVAIAQGFREAGAEWLHLVDLDGARDPAARQVELIARLVAETDLKIQTGGGLRQEAEIAALLAAGAERVVIGSVAVRDPAATRALFREVGREGLTLAIDVARQDGAGAACVAVSGWQELSAMRPEDVIEEYRPAGLRHVLCTDIARDGTLEGSDPETYRRLSGRFPDLAIQASGGIRNLDDVAALARAGCDGAIIGKALYEGRMSLAAPHAASAARG